MTILTMPRKELESSIGKIDGKMEDRISMFGTPIEEINNSEISVEVFPNRPDLLSLQGFTRAFLNFEKKTEVKDYRIEKPGENYRVVIDKSVKGVRPYTACAIVKNLIFDDEKIMEIIDIQEKLHASYGRNRRKLAIGIYPLEEIKLPIKFLAKSPEEIRLQPLEFPKVINGRQILSKHPAGREYGDLLKGQELFPIFEDANSEILSMPPIINSEKTGKISEKTTEIFVECSGFNKEYLNKSLNMIVCALADMGGKIFSMEIEDEVDGRSLSPNLDTEKMEFTIEYINKNLGLELSEGEVKNYLAKMGIGFLSGNDKSYALIPAYRVDILHEIDLVEEIAIAYGYDNFKPEIADISTNGKEDNKSILNRKISEILIGLSLLEVSTYHISTKEKQFKKIGIKEFKEKMIEIVDSKTERDILRSSLLANSISILSENLDVSYPQKIFEIGKVFYHDDSKETGIGENEKLCVSLCHEKANFTEIKQVLDYLMRMLDMEYEIKEIEDPSFIDGRCGEVIVNGKSVGILGEINLNVLKNNKIVMPVSSFEIMIDGFK